MSESPLWDGVREGCGTCEFGLRQELPVAVGAQAGTKLVAVSCRRYPPTLIEVERMNGGAKYRDIEQWTPTMPEDGWCGEYKRATNDICSDR